MTLAFLLAICQVEKPQLTARLSMQTLNRCAHCGKTHFVPDAINSWSCTRCGYLNLNELDPDEAFRATSTHFGSLLGPVAKVVESLDGDDHA